MTLSVENPTPGYVERCNCWCRGPTAVFWRRRAQHPTACMPEEAYAAQHTRTMARSATFECRQRLLIGHRSPCKGHVFSQKPVLDPFSTTLRRSGRSTAVVESPHVRTVTQGCLYLLLRHINAQPRRLVRGLVRGELATCGCTCSMIQPLGSWPGEIVRLATE